MIVNEFIIIFESKHSKKGLRKGRYVDFLYKVAEEKYYAIVNPEHSMGLVCVDIKNIINIKEFSNYLNSVNQERSI